MCDKLDIATLQGVEPHGNDQMIQQAVTEISMERQIWGMDYIYRETERRRGCRLRAGWRWSRAAGLARPMHREGMGRDKSSGGVRTRKKWQSVSARTRGVTARAMESRAPWGLCWRTSAGTAS